MAIERIDFPRLDRSWSRDEPRGSMQPSGEGPLYRSTWNLLSNNGRLQSRPALTSTVYARGTTSHTTPDSAGNDQSQIFVKRFSSLTEDDVLWATQYDIIWGGANILTHLRYATGTIAVTNGSATVTGSGTAWDSAAGDFVQRGSMIQLPDGKFYQIESIASDTSLAVTFNYQGTTLSGQSYTVQPTFVLGDVKEFMSLLTSRMHAVEFNGDIYIAAAIGQEGETLSGGKLIKDTVVIRLNNAIGRTVSSSDVEVLFGGLNAYTGADSAGYLIDPVGIDVLQDGRVVILVHRYDSSNVRSFSRMIYSSHLNQAVWTAQPGGFVDVVGSNLGSVATALGRIRNDLTVHFNGGISVVRQTGDPFFPLSPARSRSHVGAMSRKSVAEVEGNEVFLSINRSLYVFNGDSSTRLPTPVQEAYKLIRQSASTTGTQGMLDPRLFYDPTFGHLWILSQTGPVITPSTGEANANLFTESPTATKFPGSSLNGFAVVVDATTGEIVGRYVFPSPVYDLTEGVARPLDSMGAITSPDPVYLEAACRVPDAATLRLGGLLLSGGVDTIITTSALEYPQQFETDDMDLGMPGVNKSVRRIVFTYGDLQATPTGHDIGWGVSYDGGNTWENISVTLASVGGSTTHDDEKHDHVEFNEGNSGDKVRIRFRTESGVTPGSPDTWDGPMELDYYLTKFSVDVDVLDSAESR